jgi:DNA-binding beta-propeller fold protein YncE
VQCFPSNLTVTPDGTHLYVTNTNAVLVTTSPPVTGTVPKLPATCPASGTLSAFAIGGSGAAPLTEIGSPISTGGGSEPTGIIADPAGKAVYVTDAALNLLYTYAVQSDGSLTLDSTVATGTQPMGAAVVSGTSGSRFLYVTNFSAGTISSYSLGSAAPQPIATTNAGSSGPLCILVEPELQRFIYTSNYTGGFVGGAQVDPANGTLILNQGSPYPGSGQPTCVAAVAHPRGRHNGL